MSHAYPWTAAMTLMVALLISYTAAWVGVERLRTGIAAPAVTGDERFERVFRIQMNTQEGALVFLPAVWVCAVFLSDRLAAGLAGLWILSRLWYALAYWAEPSGRRPAFVLSQLLYVSTWLCGAAGIVLDFTQR
jgi:glutathione S-transferase